MKSRRRNLTRAVDPLPFDYNLLSHLYVHSDGSDVIDYGGYGSREESEKRLAENFLRQSSFVAPPLTSPTEPADDPVDEVDAEGGVGSGTFVNLQIHTAVGLGGVTSKTGDSPAVSNLVRIEDTAEHIWLLAQSDPKQGPSGRMFQNADDLFGYIQSRQYVLPGDATTSASPNMKSPAVNGEPASFPAGAMAKWIDIQHPAADEDAMGRYFQAVLERFPITEDTLQQCLYLSSQDRSDLSHLTADTSGYLFISVACTPLVDMARTKATTAEASTDSARETGKEKKHKKAARLVRHNASTTKSVMEMRFDSVRAGTPRADVPEPIAVGIILFQDWIITVHEEPFAEMDDLLRMIQMQCSPRLAQYALRTEPIRLFSPALILTTLLQIAVGHHVDSELLAVAVDELGDLVFEPKHDTKEQENVLRYITSVRRCFGECGADVSRRLAMVTSLLEPSIAQLSLFADPRTRKDLDNIVAHLDYVLYELTECRDTVAVANWHHNVALQWILLRRGNSALRMVLLLTEICNIMYPIVMFQTLYSMNVPVPFDSEGDPPNHSYAPWIVLGCIFLVFLASCSRAVLGLLTRRPFKTRLLA